MTGSGLTSAVHVPREGPGEDRSRRCRVGAPELTGKVSFGPGPPRRALGDWGSGYLSEETPQGVGDERRVDSPGRSVESVGSEIPYSSDGRGGCRPVDRRFRGVDGDRVLTLLLRGPTPHRD